jgi:hypothetical protein
VIEKVQILLRSMNEALLPDKRRRLSKNTSPGRSFWNGTIEVLLEQLEIPRLGGEPGH